MTQEKIIPISFDPIFKALFGNSEHIDILENLISLYFNISLDEVKGHVIIENNEKRIKNKKDKKQAVDIIAKFIFVNQKLCLNLEMNRKISQSIVDRNINYLSGIFYQSIKNKEKYEELPTTIQLNFNLKDIDDNNPNIIDKYYLQNKEGHCLTEKFQSHHVNIAKCYKIWYNGNISNYDEYEQQIILLGALMYTTKKQEFLDCLEDIKMEKEIKNDMTNIVDDLNCDEFINMYYDKEQHDQWLKDAEMHDAIEDAKKEGKKENQVEIAKNLLEQNIDDNIIIVCTGLTQEELETLKSN